MTPNHDGTDANEELPAAPIAIGEVRSASRTRLGLDPARVAIAVGVTLAIAVIAIFGVGGLVERMVGARSWWLRIAVAITMSPFVVVARWIAVGDVGTAAITWVGADGFAIGPRTIAFRDVGRMNLDKNPGASGRYTLVSFALRIDDRRGRKLISLQGTASSPIGAVTSSTTLADWERLEAALRAAPTASASHLIRAISDAWIAWQDHR